MAIKKYRYYFGPYGDVQVLPSVPRDAGVAPSPELYGGINRSLTGSPTLVYYGARRSWNLVWPMMSEDAARPLLRVEAAYRNRIMRSYLFLDTKNTNYLPPDVSTMASENNPTDLFTWGNGTTSRTNTGTFHSELSGLSDGYLTHTGAVATSTFSTIFQLPVIAGSQYLFSGFFAGSGTIKLALNFFNASGVYISSLVGSNVVLSGTTTGTLASLSVASGSVPGGSAAFTVGYFEQTIGVACNTNGWMVQYDETVRPTNGWLPGAGGAEVVVDSFKIQYPTYKTRQIAATLNEV